MGTHEYEFTLISARLKLHKLTQTTPYVRIFIGDLQFYRSTICQGNNPEWNEEFTVTNVRDTDIMRIEIWNDRVKDRLIGCAQISLKSELYIQEDEVACNVLVGEEHHNKHIHHRKQYISIKVKYLEELAQPLGEVPIYSYYPRFEIHNPVASGILETALPKQEDVDKCFEGKKQHWNRDYPAAQTIFGDSAKGKAIRLMIRAQCAALFSNNHKRDHYFTCKGKDDFFKVLYKQMGIPRMFTYSIIYDGMRFTETGDRFFRNFLSKHTMLALGAESVYYSDDEGESVLVIDNNSGTYSPDDKALPHLKALFELNFPGIRVETRNRDDPRTEEFKKHYWISRHRKIGKLMKKKEERDKRKARYKPEHHSELKERKKRDKEEKKKEKKKEEVLKKEQEEGNKEGEGEREGGETEEEGEEEDDEEYAEDYLDMEENGANGHEDEEDEEEDDEEDEAHGGAGEDKDGKEDKEEESSEDKKKKKEEKNKEEMQHMEKDRDNTAIMKKLELIHEDI